MRRHLSERDVEEFLAGQLKPVARCRRVVQHLISGCDRCREKLLALECSRLRGPKPLSEDGYDSCIERAWLAVRPLEALLQAERKRRDDALALVRLKGWGNLSRAERQSLHGTWAEVEMLLHLSFAARFRDPREMLHFAEAAADAAKRLNPAVYGRALVYDLRARVWAELANALRVNELFGRANAALEAARSFLDEGAGSLLIEARIDEIGGTLYNDERQLETAGNLLESARLLYLKIGEGHQAGRTMVSRGLGLILAERPFEAVQCLQDSLALLDHAKDPKLVATAQHNILFALVEAGNFKEAGQFLLQSGLRQTFANEPLILLRLRWIQGKIQAGCGRLEDAERTLTEVWQSWCERELEFVAAVAGLDLAKVLLLQGKVVAAHELAQTLYQRSTVLPHEARSALLTFELLCRHRAALAFYADRVARFLDKLQHDRSLKWNPEMLVEE